MKLVAILQIDSGWVDEPEFSPCYIFNNIRECYAYFSTIGTVTINKEPSPYNLYDFGELFLVKDAIQFTFKCVYAENN